VRDHKRGGRYSVIYLGQTANVEVALPSKTERRAQAQRHVNTGNQVIARQRELIARKIAPGQSTLPADRRLEEFLRTSSCGHSRRQRHHARRKNVWKLVAARVPDEGAWPASEQSPRASAYGRGQKVALVTRILNGVLPAGSPACNLSN